MAEAIRINSGGNWTYVPDTQEYRSRLERFSSAGMAEVKDGIVNLLSEAGPMFWDSLRRSERPQENRLEQILAMLVDDGVSLSPDEELCFGNKQNPFGYSTVLDLALMKHGTKPGISLGSRSSKDGDIVSTVWPKAKIIIPAMMSGNALELADKMPDKERCFVLDEGGKQLLTVSMPATEKTMIKVADPKKFKSWLLSAGSSAARLPAANLSVLFEDGGKFLITDSARGRIYVGRMKTSTDSEGHEFEQAMLENILASKGLGAILPKYELERGEEHP
jgi:hypothetical protein